MAAMTSTGANFLTRLPLAMQEAGLAFLPTQDVIKVASLSRALEIQVNRSVDIWKSRSIKKFGSKLADQMYARTQNWQVTYNSLCKLRICAAGILKIQEVELKKQKVQSTASRFGDIAGRIFGFGGGRTTFIEAPPVQ